MPPSIPNRTSKIQNAIPWRGRWWIAGIVLTIAWFLTLGIQRYSARRGPTAAVEALVAAIRAGNASQAMALLSPENPARQRSLGESTAEWTPSPDIQSRICRVDVFGDIATVELWLSEFGFTIRPEILLKRDPAGTWLISDISHLQVDPRWESAERDRQREENDELARELEAALRGRPGVIVHRETDDTRNR